MTRIEIAAKNIRTAADITVNRFSEEAAKVSADPDRKAAAEQMLANIRNEMEAHIVPTFEACYSERTDIVTANCKAEKMVSKYGRVAQQVCGMYMRELTKLNKNI